MIAFLFIIILFLIIILCMVYYKFLQVRDESYEYKDMFNYYKSKFSLIEYNYKNYEEGANPFTILRKIGNIVHDYYYNLGEERDEHKWKRK